MISVKYVKKVGPIAVRKGDTITILCGDDQGNSYIVVDGKSTIDYTFDQVTIFEIKTTHSTKLKGVIGRSDE